MKDKLFSYIHILFSQECDWTLWFIHLEPKLTCSLSSFCCSLFFLSSSSTLLTWMYRSFCTHTELASIFYIFHTETKPKGKTGWNKTWFLPFLFLWFPHEAPWETCESETNLYLPQTNTKTTTIQPSDRWHSLPVQCLVYQLSLKPGKEI